MAYNIVLPIYITTILLVHQCKSYNVHFNTNKTITAKQLGSSSSCDIFDGSWEYNEDNTPYYNTSTCPFISNEFDCQKNGRPDEFYLKYKWRPNSCSLPSFDGEDFLRRFKGKKIMFVGDSLSLDQWQSLTCMLHASVPQSNYNLISNKGGYTTFYIQDYNISVMLYRTPYLVDVVSEKMGRILKLDSIEGGNAWKDMDLLIFNSWHWWVHTGTQTGWDYIQKGRKTYKDMDRLKAFKYGLTTWSKWVENNTNSQKTQVFFQNISPTHYRSNEWNITSGNCKGETRPIAGSKYPAGLPEATQVVKQVLSKVSSKVVLLDITTLSQLRKDGHPSIYGSDLDRGNDCSHWCLPGVPDTWNQLLYTLILNHQSEKWHHY